MKLSRRSLAVATVIAGASINARAVPIEPSDYIPAPPGTMLGVGYYNYIYSDAVNIDGVGDISNKTSSNVNAGLLRGVWYPKSSFSMPFNVQLLMPFASVNGQINGANVSSNGLQTGDPLFGGVIWPLNDAAHGRWLGIASITSVPLGSYDRFRPVSIGKNVWTENLQAVFIQQFGNGWQVDVAGDVIFYSDNHDYGTGSQSQTLSQKNTYELQLWLSKTLSTAPLSRAGIGYANVKGGRMVAAGQPTGLRTDYQQVRAYASCFVAQTWEVLGEVNHAFATRGGFNQTFGLTLRLVKVF
jgi:hypothetical protein